jgi:L-ascorbate metabolism protein UlaG (beta-lactamase superfamily)
MNVKWLGHASFLITSAGGVRIVTDPYTTGKGIEYGEIRERADVVLVSHGHGDHSNTAAVGGNPVVVDRAGTNTAKGIEFKGVSCYHDADEGAKRGSNTVFLFTVDGLKVAFLGDLGHPFSVEEAAEIGVVDVLLTPVGGFYTIDAADADRVCEALKPKVVIPMHYKTEKCGYPIAGVEDFLKNKQRVRRLGTSEVDILPDTLPAETEVVVLHHAL